MIGLRFWAFRRSLRSLATGLPDLSRHGDRAVAGALFTSFVAGLPGPHASAFAPGA
jgi:hypothetical protein